MCYFDLTIYLLGKRKAHELSSESQVKSSQEKVKEKSPKKERLDFAYSIFISPPTHPTLNFSNTSRGPRRQWNTFLRSTQHLELKY